MFVIYSLYFNTFIYYHSSPVLYYIFFFLYLIHFCYISSCISLFPVFFLLSILLCLNLCIILPRFFISSFSSYIPLIFVTFPSVFHYSLFSFSYIFFYALIYISFFPCSLFRLLPISNPLLYLILPYFLSPIYSFTVHLPFFPAIFHASLLISLHQGGRGRGGQSRTHPDTFLKAIPPTLHNNTRFCLTLPHFQYQPETIMDVYWNALLSLAPLVFQGYRDD